MDVGTAMETETGIGTGVRAWEGSKRVYLNYTGLLELDSIIDFIGMRNHQSLCLCLSVCLSVCLSIPTI